MCLLPAPEMATLSELIHLTPTRTVDPSSLVEKTEELANVAVPQNTKVVALEGFLSHGVVGFDDFFTLWPPLGCCLTFPGSFSCQRRGCAPVGRIRRHVCHFHLR